MNKAERQKQAVKTLESLLMMLPALFGELPAEVKEGLRRDFEARLSDAIRMVEGP